LGRYDYVEGFQTSAHHKEYLGCLSPARDVEAFYKVVTVRFGELDQGDSWFYEHAHRWIHSINFTCKTNGKILFYMIIFLLFYYMKIFN
jgi:hypothetical protein